MTSGNKMMNGSDDGSSRVDASVVVKFFAGVRELTRERYTRVPLDGSETVEHVLHRLSALYGEAFRGLVLSPSGLGDGIVVLVNGRNARLDGGGRATVRPGDEIAVFSLVAGG